MGKEAIHPLSAVTPASGMSASFVQASVFLLSIDMLY